MSETRQMNIGTSGWHYNHWRGPFYPPELSTDRFLSFYAGYFKTVEINNSFYKQPAEETLEEWRDSVPADFTFAYKASRFITHMKKLKDPEDPIRRLISRASILGEHLGPILFQLPPPFHVQPRTAGNIPENPPCGIPLCV